MATDSTRSTAEPEASSGNKSSPRAESENSSGKVVRTPRVLTNVSTLARAVVSQFNDEIDTVMLSDAVAYRERKDWKRARAADRKALRAHGVMSVMPTPVGVKTIKSRFLFKRRYKKDGSIRKHKARLVALGYVWSGAWGRCVQYIRSCD